MIISIVFFSFCINDDPYVDVSYWKAVMSECVTSHLDVHKDDQGVNWFAIARVLEYSFFPQW